VEAALRKLSNSGLLEEISSTSEGVENTPDVEVYNPNEDL